MRNIYVPQLPPNEARELVARLIGGGEGDEGGGPPNWFLLDLPLGATATLTFSVMVDQDTAGQTLANTVLVDKLDEIDRNTANNSSSVSIVPVVDSTPPTSSVAALPAFSPGRFSVSWSGADDAGATLTRACDQAGITPFVPKPLNSNSKAEGRFGKPDFIYIASDDEYRCPAGQRLIKRFTTVEAGMTLNVYWSSACPRCPIKAQCTTGSERRVRRWVHEAVIDAMQERLDRDPEKMRKLFDGPPSPNGGRGRRERTVPAANGDGAEALAVVDAALAAGATPSTNGHP